MADERENPEDVFKRLLQGATPARTRSLKALHEVCKEQRNHGSHDFSLVTIGRLSKLRNGPAAAALGNPAGRVYRQLIAAHRDASSPQTKKAVRSAPVDTWDPLSRAHIQQLEDQLRSLRNQVTDLQRIANKTARVAVTKGDAHDGSATLQANFVGAIAPDLLPFEEDAVVNALDPRRLRRAGLVVGAHGRLHTTVGEELFPIGFATGLAKLLKALGLLAFNRAP